MNILTKIRALFKFINDCYRAGKSHAKITIFQLFSNFLSLDIKSQDITHSHLSLSSFIPCNVLADLVQDLKRFLNECLETESNSKYSHNEN